MSIKLNCAHKCNISAVEKYNASQTSVVSTTEESWEVAQATQLSFVTFLMDIVLLLHLHTHLVSYCADSRVGIRLCQSRRSGVSDSLEVQGVGPQPCQLSLQTPPLGLWTADQTPVLCEVFWLGLSWPWKQQTTRRLLVACGNWSKSPSKSACFTLDSLLLAFTDTLSISICAHSSLFVWWGMLPAFLFYKQTPAAQHYYVIPNIPKLIM